MKQVMWIGVVIFAMARLAGAATGSMPESTIEPAKYTADTTEAQLAPVISEDGAWAGKLGGLIVLGFFVPAALVGPIVWARRPRVPVMPSHVAEHKGHDDGHASHGH